MEKAYRFVEHPEPILEAEIRRLYDGYWVYIVKAKLTETGGIVAGIPVIIGDTPYAGAKDGIYDTYNSDEYVERVGLSLRRRVGVISSLRVVGEVNV